MEQQLAQPLMDTVRVTFHPKDTSVEVSRGVTVLEAAASAGVIIASICGGDGICGKCRVIIQSGEVDTDPTTLLTREEIQQGYVLACTTRLVADTEVMVPPESRAEGAQILIDEDARRFRAFFPTADKPTFFRHNPIVQKLYLELPPPTLEDNLASQERLFREIRRRVDSPVMQMGLKVLRSLPVVNREDKWQVTATVGQRGGTTEVIQVESGDQTERSYGVAIDVGTSTVVAHLVDLSTSETIDAEACYNSQAIFGSEVTRRIIQAEREGAKALRDAVVGDINNLISAFVTRNPVELHDIVTLLAAGNTTMLHFLLGLDPTHIRKSPYIPTTTAPPPVRASEVGIKINPRGLLYAMPSVGSWVGGDVAAGILATGLYQSNQLTMLIDIGTNAEIVLGNRDWMLSCAASAGPAFEGSGVKCGMRASRGAIERASVDSDGHFDVRTIGNAPPEGICGSGLIDAIAGLYQAGILDRSGSLLPDCSPRVRDFEGQMEFVLVAEGEDGATRDIVIAQPDIENLLRAKAAIYSGAKVLLDVMHLSFLDVEQLLIAGGFGNYLDRAKAMTLGMIPDIPLERIRFVGNTSLIGAKMAMLSTDAFEASSTIAHGTTYYDLITYPQYYEEFMSAKFIPHTHMDLFPTAVASRPMHGEEGS
ncbi:MAG: ASKHA domain-containing protein [Candidatus Bipolaricaulota bacterium]